MQAHWPENQTDGMREPCRKVARTWTSIPSQTALSPTQASTRAPSRTLPKPFAPLSQRKRRQRASIASWRSSLSLVALATAICALTQCHVTYALKAEKGRGRESIRSLEEVSIVDVRGECAAIEAGSTCNEVLNAISFPNDRLVWVPVEAELSNGTIVELGRDWLIGVEERKLAQHDPLRSFLGDTCHVVIFNGVCLNTYHGCVEIDGRAYPRPSCQETCEAMWETCGDIFSFAAENNLQVGLPRCGVFDADTNPVWSLFKAPTLAFLTQETVKTENTLVPPSYAGLRSYPPATFQVGDPAVTATCRPDVAGITGSNESNSTDILSCKTGISCQDPFVVFVDESSCEWCAIRCPMDGVDISEKMRSIELVTAIIALPMLLWHARFGFKRVSKSGSRADALLLICTVLGVIYASLIVIFVGVSANNGCPSSGMLHLPRTTNGTLIPSPFWTESSLQVASCALLAPSIHLSQAMYGAMTTFVIVVDENVRRAVTFQRPSNSIWQASRIIGFITIFFVPMLGIVLTSTRGVIVMDDYFSSTFHLDLVRYLYKCGPSFEKRWHEVAATDVPFVLSSLACIIYSIRLLLLCLRLRRSISTQEHMQGIAKLAMTLAKQVITLVVGAQVLLCCSIVRNWILNTNLQVYTDQLIDYAGCSTYNDECTKPTTLEASTNFIMLTMFSWNLLPFSLAIFLTLSVAARSIASQQLNPRSMLKQQIASTSIGKSVASTKVVSSMLT